jgi:hypothetical protein
VLLLHVERVLPEHLAGGEVHQALDRVAGGLRRLEHVVRADDVDPHRPHGAGQHRVDAGDAGAVDDVRRTAHQTVETLTIEYVRPDEREVRVLGERRTPE